MKTMTAPFSPATSLSEYVRPSVAGSEKSGAGTPRTMSEAPRAIVASPSLRDGAAAPRLSSSVEPFGDPELDQRLPGHAEAPGLAVKRLDHPCGKIDVDAPKREVGTPGLLPVDLARHILARVECLIELTRFHKNRPPLSATGGPR